MPDVRFHIEGVEPLRHCAAPTIAMKLRLTNAQSDVEVLAAVIRCQVRIEPARRRYTPQEQEQLFDLFGDAVAGQWSRSLQPLLWTQVVAVSPSFAQTTLVDLLLPCTADVNVAAGKYLLGIDSGDIPICLLFSGSVFYRSPGNGLQVEPIPWDREISWRLPLSVWNDAVSEHFPNAAWLCVNRSTLRALSQYKRQVRCATWEQMFEKLAAIAAGPPASIDIELPALKPGGVS